MTRLLCKLIFWLTPRGDSLEFDRSRGFYRSAHLRRGKSFVSVSYPVGRKGDTVVHVRAFGRSWLRMRADS